MGQPVDANGRSILHKGHGMTHTCAVPDVCKTPSPGGPIPIPYVNIAMDSDITDGAESVQIEGNPVANVSAKISTSSGDEAGSAGGGLISGKIKGSVTWMMGSLDVKAEGQGVVRFLDTNFHNGNSFNTSFKALGGTGLAYADDYDGPCPICKKAMDEHKILETVSSAEKCAAIVEELRARFNEAKGPARKLYAKKGRRGYMVGVMVCKCDPPKSFAAMSGTYSLKGFKDVAENHVDQVVNSGNIGDTARALGPSDYANANTSEAPKYLVAHEVKKAWDKAQDAFKSNDQNYSPPGICAGAHLVARSGHAPVQMTEMFFAPSGDWPKTYGFRVEGVRRIAAFGTNVESSEATPWGASVGSCKTCQDLLFLSMCPERKCK